MSKPEATICRQYFPKYTKGTLKVDNGFECDTLELPDKGNERSISCIPEGVYDVQLRHSAKYGHHLHVTDVVDRDLILIHWGNYAGSKNPKTGTPDIRGCVLVGHGYADLDGDGLPEIVNSKKAFIALMTACPDGFQLTVTQ